MDTIVINSKFKKEDFINLNLIVWKVNTRTNRRQLPYYSLLAVIVFLIGIISISEEEPSNPFIFIGIALIFLNLFFLYILFFQKLALKRRLEKICLKYLEKQIDSVYEFSDLTAKYSDKEKSYEFKWEAFSYYIVFKNYLILAIDYLPIAAFVFERKEDDFVEFDKIHELVKQKLTLKELK
jgi:hypothetical protein